MPGKKPVPWAQKRGPATSRVPPSGGSESALVRIARRQRNVETHVLHEPLEILEVRELESDAALPLAHIDAHWRLETVREPAGQIDDVRVVGAAAHGPGGRLLLPTPSDQALHSAHGEARLHDPLGELLHECRIIERQQRAGMSCTDGSAGQPALHESREAQQAKRVRDLGAGAADALTELRSEERRV